MEGGITELVEIASESDRDLGKSGAAPDARKGRTYLEQLHESRKDRLVRMGSGPVPKPIIIRDPVIEEENGLLKARIADLNALIDDLQNTITKQRGYIIKLTDGAEAPAARIEEIIHVVSARYGIVEAELIGPNRETRIVIPRQLVCYLACRSGHSLNAIAKRINRDHTSVIHGRERTEQRLSESQSFRAIVESIQVQISELATRRSGAVNDILMGAPR